MPKLGQRAALVDRLSRRITLNTETGCWEWQGSKTNGYGKFSITERTNSIVHRLVYEMVIGPIPAGLQLDHLCRNRGCVNPQHLEPVTARENTLRGIGRSAMNARKTHCPVGHPYDAANTHIDRGSRICKACKREKHRLYALRYPERVRASRMAWIARQRELREHQDA